MNPRSLPPWRLGCALLSGTLVVLSFPLFGSEMGLDPLVWIALVPLFLAAVGVGLGRGAFLGWCAGLVVEGAGFIWILLALRRFTGLPSIVTSLFFLIWVLYSSAPWAILGAVLGRCSRPSGLLWALAFWVGVEHGFPRLFPWHLGGAVHEREWLLQTVDVWGASGLTALVLLTSAVATYLVLFVLRRAPFPKRSLVVLVVFHAASLVYGAARLRSVTAVEDRAPPLRVAAIQGALDPRSRGISALDVYRRATERALSEERAAATQHPAAQDRVPTQARPAARKGADSRQMSEAVGGTGAGEGTGARDGAEGPDGLDLVVWPEGSAEHADFLPFDLDPARNSRRLAWKGRDLADSLQAFVEATGVPLVAGGSGYRDGREPPFSNVAAYLRPGKTPAYYEKNVRIPFGEVVPFLDLLPRPFRERLGLHHVGTIAAGSTQPLFALGDHVFRTLICYEATLPAIVARSAPGADFIVNITEDVWYGRTAHIPQHVSILRLRVVENRVPILRATNIGPSGVFGITGRLERGRKILAPEEVVGTLRPASVPTVYGSVGRFLPYALLALALLRWVALRLGRVGGR